MAEVIGPEGIRVRFDWRGELDPDLRGPMALCQAVAALEASGMCPVLDDGLSAGNAACRVDGRLWVSPSGRIPGQPLTPEDLVCVEDFDPTNWRVRGRGRIDDATGAARRPTSDTPLHWTSLVDAPRELGWSETPRFALHGHALDDIESAEALGIPCSPDETLFSTPPDRDALRTLLAAAPYPTTRVWIRRGHGFFLLAPTLEDALMGLESLAAAATRLSPKK